MDSPVFPPVLVPRYSDPLPHGGPGGPPGTTPTGGGGGGGPGAPGGYMGHPHGLHPMHSEPMPVNVTYSPSGFNAPPMIPIDHHQQQHSQQPNSPGGLSSSAGFSPMGAGAARGGPQSPFSLGGDSPPPAYSPQVREIIKWFLKSIH